MRFTFGIVLIIVVFGQIAAQSTAYVINVGPTAGLQKWDNSFDREPLFKYHASLAIETLNNEADKSAVFAQLGYHVKGSATRFRYFNINSGFPAGTFTEEFKFNNFSLLLGAKQKFELGKTGRSRYFYFGGIRGDYTYSTNLDELASAQTAALFYPQVGGVQRWMFGVSVGGGLEFSISELVGGQINLSINPDLTNQYYQPQSPPLINPFDPSGGSIVISERRIRNTTVELSFGIRLLRKVVYVE